MIYFKLILTAVFWGGTFIAGKLISHNIDPFSAAFIRFLIASFFLVILTIKIEGHLPKLAPGEICIVFLLGLTGVFSYNLFFFSGLNHIQANQASLIIASNPIFISLCSVIFFKETLNLMKIIGLCLSVTGALIVISNGNLFDILELKIGKGELLVLGCVASWVAYSILGKKAMNNLSPIASVCYSSIAGTLLLFFPALFKGVFLNMASYEPLEWASLFYLGFFGTVLGFFWYYEGIKQIGPMKAGIFINFVPISAMVLSFFILKEPLTPSLIFGAVFVIAGVYLTNAVTLKK
ncbi:DMT family transporter [Desulfobacula sp.]|uniref:DMT family transporter n=1 Tax=Desulfobacula sp. TaxID=2593537 RepID=UPI00262C85FF|nr:DMT family transporter [Desulfobacula sp.]